ncbi:MAG: hypothetical protein KDA89_20960 [Planctomycetaceae bacterium]|nr:hypothetical protein [Planctomycetaceae bacterium]
MNQFDDHSDRGTVTEPMRKLSTQDAQQLLSHLDAQEAAMLALKNLLRDIGREAVEPQADRRLRQRMQAAADLCGKLDADCRLLVERIGTVLKIPSDQLLLRRVAAVIRSYDPELSRSLSDARRRLLQLAQQIHQTFLTTGWLLQNQHQRYQVLLEIATGHTASDRYDATGRKSVVPNTIRYGTRS